MGDWKRDLMERGVTGVFERLFEQIDALSRAIDALAQIQRDLQQQPKSQEVTDGQGTTDDNGLRHGTEHDPDSLDDGER